MYGKYEMAQMFTKWGNIKKSGIIFYMMDSLYWKETFCNTVGTVNTELRTWKFANFQKVRKSDIFYVYI